METNKYQEIPNNIMNSQINLRLTPKILSAATSYAQQHGFGNVQEFIRETMREKLFDEEEISEKELSLVKQLSKVSKEKNLVVGEKELLSRLNRR